MEWIIWTPLWNCLTRSTKMKSYIQPFSNIQSNHLMKLLGQVYHMKLHPSNLLRTSKWISECVCVCVFLSFFPQPNWGLHYFQYFHVSECNWSVGMMVPVGRDQSHPQFHIFFWKIVKPHHVWTNWVRCPVGGAPNPVNCDSYGISIERHGAQLRSIPTTVRWSPAKTE